jgi:peptidoglycan/xylan/chitin deacetylase (PgdA/CDA1 family)
MDPNRMAGNRFFVDQVRAVVPLALVWAALAGCLTWMPAARAACKPVYLTLDTGNMRDAQGIAEFLRERDIRATFFLANEKNRARGLCARRELGRLLA